MERTKINGIEIGQAAQQFGDTMSVIGQMVINVADCIVNNIDKAFAVLLIATDNTFEKMGEQVEA